VNVNTQYSEKHVVMSLHGSSSGDNSNRRIISPNTARYCYLDFDFDNERRRHAVAAAFVDATDMKYGFSSKDIRFLGGSERARINELLRDDHDWSTKMVASEVGDNDTINVNPPLQHGTRIVLKLYWDVAPLACENFARLCWYGSSSSPGSSSSTAPAPPIGESGRPLTYKNSAVHRIVAGFVLQGGDFVFGNGSGGEPAINNGKKFKDEKAGLQLKHNGRGVLSMGNSGKNSNSSQFFLTLDCAPQCDGKHVIFGQVVSGFDVLDAAERYGSSNGTPTVPVVITDCGIWDPLTTPGSGYWYDQPDADSYTGTSPIFVVRPRVVCVVATSAAASKFRDCFKSYASVVDVIVREDDDNIGGDESKAPAILSRLSELLDDYRVDVVVVAPACAQLVSSLELPNTWRHSDDVDNQPFRIDEVVLEAKPVDALRAIRTNSWLATRTGWHLDGGGGTA